MSSRGRPVSALRGGLVYFAVVFAAGFALGAIRVPLLEPRLGERTAQLIEMPIMLAVVYLAAGRVVRRGVAGDRWLVVGGVALALLVGAELLLLVSMSEEGLAADLAGRDPVAGAAYLAALSLFAIMPWWRARRMHAGSQGRKAAALPDPRRD